MKRLSNGYRRFSYSEEEKRSIILDTSSLSFHEYIKLDRDKSTFKSHRDFSSEIEITFKHF